MVVKKKKAAKKGATKKAPKKKGAVKKADATPESPGDRIKPYRWKPGQSGNPKGRPKGITSLAKLLRDQLNERASLVPAIRIKAEALGLDSMRTTVGAVLMLSLINDATNEGNATIAKEIIQRIDGIVVDPAKPSVDDDAHERIPLADLEVRVKRALKRRQQDKD